MKALRSLCGVVAIAACAFGQGAPLSPSGPVQYFTNNGLPNAGGSLCTYVSGTSSPLAIYHDSALTSPWPTCATLDSAGRLSAFMGSGTYRFVLLDAASVTIWTIDGIAAVNPGSAGGYWSQSGNTIYNNVTGSKICIGPTACTTALSQFNVQGASSGSNYLVRIDDSAGAPGISLYASGNAIGSYGGDSAGLRLRDGSGTSQLTVSSGVVAVQNAGASGATTLNVNAGVGQNATNLFQVRQYSSSLSPGGSSGLLAWIDSAGRFVSPLFNSTATGASISFQNSNSNFSVDGNGDVSTAGTINVVGAVSSTNPSGVAIALNGTPVLDNLGNATVTSLTCTGSPCGSGGGGGGFPVSDSTTLFYNSSTPTKTAKFDFAALTASTLRTYSWPDDNVTVVGRENNETLSGQKIFSALVYANSGVIGPTFNSTATGTTTAFDLANLNLLIDGKANITTSCTAGCTAGVDGANSIFGGYVTAGTWFGLHPTVAAPSTTPGGGFSGFSYKGGASGLEVWLYDTVHSAWSAVDLGVAGSGVGTINGQTGPAITVLGTSNEINVVTAANTLTISTPQAIATGSTPTFAGVVTPGAFNSTVTGAGIGLQVNGGAFQVNGYGDISGGGQINVLGTGPLDGGFAYKVGGVGVIDSARNATFNTLTVTSCTGCGGGGGGVTSATGSGETSVTGMVAVNGDFSGGSHTGSINLTLPQCIGTGCSVTFANTTAGSNSTSGTLQAWASNGTGSIPIQVVRVGSGGAVTPFQVDGVGDVSGAGQANFVQGYKSNSILVINGFGQFVGAGVDVGSNGISAGAYGVNGGFIGQNWNLGFPSPFTINGAGSFTTLVVKGGIIVSAF